MPKSHKLVYVVYLIICTIMAINPKYFNDWMDKKHHYTLLSIILLLLFSSLHSLGSHYTYAQMEHFNTSTQFFGFARNHFDRLVHFVFALLLFRILFEMIAGVINLLFYKDYQKLLIQKNHQYKMYKE